MSPSSAEIPLLDRTAIEKLRSLAGDEDQGFVAEMAQLFLGETAKSLAELRIGCDQGDGKLIAQISHSLKSSAATLGLMRLSNACKALELDAKNATFGAETLALADAVFGEFEQTIPILKGLS